MGLTLSTSSAWTSARDDGETKLEYTPINARVLNGIITYVEGFSGRHADLYKLTFQSPLVWTSTVAPDQLGSDFTQKGNETVSNSETKDGQPLCTLTQKGSAYEVSVYSLEYCDLLLKAAGEQKMAECRACLEANRDPVANMTGDRFATVTGEDSSAFRYMDEIMQIKPTEGEDSQEAQEEIAFKKSRLRLLFIMKKFDESLMQECVKEISSQRKIQPSDVEQAVNLLMEYCGEDEDKHVLEYLNWHSAYKMRFPNGCRALPMRQVHGDIAYIEVRPHDTSPFCVTANTNGYFISKMALQPGSDKSEFAQEFEPEGEFEKDLIVLLRNKSPRFNELIDKQEIFKRREDEKKGLLDLTEEQDTQDQDRDKEYTHRSEKQKDSKERSVGDKKKKGQQKKKLEPSLRWKMLDMEDPKERETNQKKKYKTVGKKTENKSMKQPSASDGEDSFEESSSESEEEEDTLDRRNDTNTDLPSEYWQIQKLVKYLKCGNQTATVIALCSMRDFNLQQETCQLAIRDVGGLEVLINLLDTDELRCKIGSLQILKEISKNPQIRRAIADLGGLQTMVKILRNPHKDLKCLAAETIANVAKFRRARRTVRQHGGIKKLVALLDCKQVSNASTRDMQKDVEVARCGALALWSCSKSTLNKQAMRRAGAIPLLAKLLKSSHENMLIPVVGTLQECATEQSYRLAIRTEGMVEDLVKNLKSENPELQMHCASAIFKSAEEKATRDLVRQFGGLDPLVTLLNQREDKELLAAATGAIWKCSISEENVIRFKELKAIELLVGLLHDQPEEVLVNVVGGLAELAKDQANRLTIRKAGGIQPLVGLLTGTNQALLVNVTKAVGQCAEEPDNMAVIDKLDGVRLLWSLLKNQNTQVQASAAWAICPCIENAKDAGEMVRSFVGGLELIVGLLESDDKEVLASVCAAIANIASDEENLAVITDHGVVPKLASLTNTNEDRLRRHLAEAVARCCNWGNNRVSFGHENAVAPLVYYLRSKDREVHRSTARALHQLSKDPDNCITMHEAGVVKPLMEMVGSDDDVLQEASAGCIANIRRLALANEKARK